MRVYILISSCNGDECIDKVFSSYSAMLTWLKEIKSFESELFEFSDESGGAFKEKHLNKYFLRYEAIDVIGEHSVTTDKIEFK